jgi:CTP:molybdopterin cytidylyltransferase MocA
MQPVAVRIVHPSAPDGTRPLTGWLANVRARNADRLANQFAIAGVADVEIVRGSFDDRPFGARLRAIAAALPAGAGLVVLGSGAIPLATAADVAAFVAVAASQERRALANNAYSADVVAVGRPDALRDVPDLPGDNALPRWLEEAAGFDVVDLRRRWRLSVDLDSPLDALLIDRTSTPPEIDLAVFRDRLAAVRSVGADRRAELVIAGRTSARTLQWLERSTAARTRALIEERGLRASSLRASGTGAPGPGRPPRSIVGMVLDARGPDAFGSILAELGDGAIVDTRVLLAHRLGGNEAAWPVPEDRYASDLLLPDRIADPWLRALTDSAAKASIPILLGGHSLVGPGVRLVLRPGR